MDPLSVAASVIAVVQAAQTAFDGVQKFRDAPKEFLELKTELGELIGISTAVWHCVKVIDNAECHEKQDTEKDELLGSDELIRLKRTATDLKLAIDGIGKVVESSRDAKGRLNRIIWLRKNATASKDLRKTARRLQLNLAFHLHSLTPVQIARHSQKAGEEFKKLQQLFTASKVAHDLPERRWESSSGKPLRRWDTQLSTSETLPFYSAKASSHSLAGSDAPRTPKVPWYTALNKRPDSLSGSENILDHNSIRSSNVPINESLANESQPEKMAEAVLVNSSERCSSSTRAQDSTPLIYEHHLDPTQTASNSQHLLQTLDAHIPRETDENVPGSVGGLLEYETLPPPETSEPVSLAQQEPEPTSQAIQDSHEPVEPARMHYRSSPVQHLYYWHGDFRNDYLDMYDCSCPRSITLRPPRWLGYLFGLITLAFCMPSIPGSLVCCNIMCKGKPKQYIRLDIQLPLWLATSTCLSVIYWDSTSGVDRFLQWRKLREIEDPETVLAIERGDVCWLQQQVATKRLLPFDVLKGIGDPLAYSLNNIESGDGFDVTAFLFRSGFHSLSVSYQGYNASYIARLKMKAGIEYEQRHVWSILRDIADLDQNPRLHHSTPLHDAALHQTRMGVREALAKGTEGINDFDGLGFTAVHWSTLREDLPQVKALLKAGADVNLPTMVQKWSALHLACMRSSFEISSALLGAGAKLEQEDSKGRTPLHYIHIRDAALVELLLNNGADAKHVDYHDNTALHTMAWNKPPYLPRDRRSDAPRDGVSTINMFISRGIGMDVRNARGETPTLLMAMRNPSLFGLPDAPSVMSYQDMRAGSGWNILHCAAYYWDAHALLQLGFDEATIFFGPPGFDPDAVDAQGRTPLDALEHRMFAAEEERTAGVLRPTREEVRLFVDVLQECRASNWREGCYLETRQRLSEDGSLEKMEAWQRRQRDGRQRRPSDRTSLWEATDGWWRDMAEQPEEASEWQ